MLVAATVTSGCHTSDVAADSGDGTTLTNGMLGNCLSFAPPFLVLNGLTFYTLLSCSRLRLMLSEQYYSTSQHRFGVWLYNLRGDLCHSTLFG